MTAPPRCAPSPTCSAIGPWARGHRASRRGVAHRADSAGEGANHARADRRPDRGRRSRDREIPDRAAARGARMPDPTIRIRRHARERPHSARQGDARSAQRDARIAAEYIQAHELVSSEFAALLVQARAACAAGAREETRSNIAESALQRAEEVRTFSSNPTLRASLWRPLRPAFGFTIGVLARANSCGGSAAADPLGALRSRKRHAAGRSKIFGAASTADPSRNRKRTSGAASCSSNWPEFVSNWKRCPRRFPRTMRDWKSCARKPPACVARSICRAGCPTSSRLRTEDLRPALRARIDAIPADTAVVEYWIGKDEAFAWLLTRGRVQLVDLGPRGVASTPRHGACTTRCIPGSPERSKNACARARELHELIIAPLPAELARARTVYFIPDGALHAVPFAALAHGDSAQPRFFVESHDVAVAPAFLAIALRFRVAGDAQEARPRSSSSIRFTRATMHGSQVPHEPASGPCRSGK